MAHTYIIGTSGAGKSTLMLQNILDSIHAGNGVLFMDPHGHDIDDLLQYIPARRRKDVILFDPSNAEHPMAWNPLENVTDTAFVASSFLDSFKDAWGYAGMTTPTLDMYLYHSISALIEAKETLAGIQFMLTSTPFRDTVLKKVKDPITLSFWRDFDELTAKEKREAVSSTYNKVNQLIADPRIRHTIGQHHSAFQMSDVLKGKILLVKLPQGKLGVQKVKILGILLLSQLHLSALSRTSREPFDVYIDEVHSFSGNTLCEMFSGVRKYNVSLTVAHQYLDQLDNKLRSAILGNVAMKYIFRVSRRDADFLNDEIGPNQVMINLHEQSKFNARVFSEARPREVYVDELQGIPSKKARADILTNTIRNYTRPRKTVETEFNAKLP